MEAMHEEPVGGRHGHRRFVWHEGRRHHGDFPPPWAGWEGWGRGFGFGGGFGGPGGPGGRGGPGGHRARRGDIPVAILSVLAEQPMHGYDLIRELETRSGGVWHPSAGSVYPTLQMLQEQGLLTSEEQDGKRVYSITDAGRAHLEERSSRPGGSSPWEFAREGAREGKERFGKLFAAMGQLGGAVMQVAREGSTEQVEQVAQIVAEARKKAYALLAES